jgi:RNA polymerase sigma factor (sigma-70 family)
VRGGRQFETGRENQVPELIAIIESETDLLAFLREAGFQTEQFESAEEFLQNDRRGEYACLVVNSHLPGVSGLDLLETFRQQGHRAPIVFVTRVPIVLMTRHGEIPAIVQAMRAGALTVLEAPVDRDELITNVSAALAEHNQRAEILAKFGKLTAREREVAELVGQGETNKEIAARLGVSQTTIGKYVQEAKKKLGTSNRAELTHMFDQIR